jgi:hypothetical protein
VVINVEGGNRTGVPAGDEQTELHPSPYEVIPKVRAQLRRVAGDLFTPHTVPIGPYHQDVESWLWTEEKKRAVHHLGRRGVDLEDLRLVLVGVQSRARGYYTHLPDEHAMDSEKFCTMLLRDGCYLLSIFVQYEGESPTVEPSGSNRQLTTSLSSDNTVVRDILYLLENQIPMFVIDEIVKYLTAPGEDNSALKCIARPVEDLLQSQLYISDSPREAPLSSSPTSWTWCTSMWRRSSSIRRRRERHHLAPAGGAGRRSTAGTLTCCSSAGPSTPARSGLSSPWT